MRRLLFASGAAALILTVAAGPAAAVGVADVDMAVGVPRAEDGRRHLHVAGEPTTIDVVLRNLAPEERTVQLAAVGVRVGQDGTTSLTDEQQAAWVGLPRREVTLAGGERTVFQVTVDPASVPEGAHVAFVLSAGQGDSVVAQAASVVRITAEAPPPPWLLWLIALALLLVVATAVIRELRRRRAERRGRIPGVLAPA